MIDLPEGLVWSLLSGPGARLYAATGDQGEIYEIDAAGTTRSVGTVPDAHTVCLAWQDDQLLCGTDGRGLLVALDPGSGEARVLYDTGQEEIVALMPREDGTLLFAANGSREEGGSSTTSSVPLMMRPIEVHADNGSTGCLYERLPSGLVRQIWQCPEEDILDLAAAPDGTILVATGSEGVLYALDAEWNATRLLDLEEAQLLTLAVDGSQLFVGTGNGGSVYRLDWDAARTGTYTSRVWDATPDGALGRTGLDRDRARSGALRSA